MINVTSLSYEIIIDLQVLWLTKWTKFGYKLVCSQFVTTHYVVIHKIIYMYYLNKLYDSLNWSCD